MQKTNQAVDFVKLFFAYCIVGIHTVILQDVNYDCWYYIQHMIFRIAVPFFFMCSGYFYKPQKDDSLLPKQVQRLIIPYFAWSIAFTIVTRDFDLKEILKGYLIASPGASMWFVAALMISMVILKLIKNKKALSIAICISMIFYFVGLFLDSYSEITRGTIFEPYALKYIELFGSTRNFVFIGFPMTSIGYYIGQYGIPKLLKNKINCVVTFIVAWIVLFFEVNFVKNMSNTFSEGWSYFFLLPLVVLSLLCFLLQLNINLNVNTFLLRKISTGIYFSHLVILVCVNTLGGILCKFNIIEQNFNTVLIFLLVSVIATIFSIVVIKLNNKLLNKLF